MIEKIADVLTYVRQEWGNTAGPVGPEGVAALRKEFAGRAESWTEPDILRCRPTQMLPEVRPRRPRLARRRSPAEARRPNKFGLSPNDQRRPPTAPPCASRGPASARQSDGGNLCRKRSPPRSVVAAEFFRPVVAATFSESSCFASNIPNAPAIPQQPVSSKVAFRPGSRPASRTMNFGSSNDFAWQCAWIATGFSRAEIESRPVRARAARRQIFRKEKSAPRLAQPSANAIRDSPRRTSSNRKARER